MSLKTRQVLEPANKAIKHNYFLVSGLASVIAIGKNGHRLEVGIIGREGMTGLPVVLGNDPSPNETFIQVAGAGSRISSKQALLPAKSVSRWDGSRPVANQNGQLQNTQPQSAQA